MIKLTILAILASLMIHDSCASSSTKLNAKQRREAFQALSGITYTDTVKRANSHKQTGNQVFHKSKEETSHPKPEGTADQQEVKAKLTQILGERDDAQFMTKLRESKLSELKGKTSTIKMHVEGGKLYATATEDAGKMETSILINPNEIRTILESYVKGGL